jgi:hypothetical protein
MLDIKQLSSALQDLAEYGTIYVGRNDVNQVLDQLDKAQLSYTWEVLQDNNSRIELLNLNVKNDNISRK